MNLKTISAAIADAFMPFTLVSPHSSSRGNSPCLLDSTPQIMELFSIAPGFEAMVQMRTMELFPLGPGFEEKPRMDGSSQDFSRSPSSSVQDHNIDMQFGDVHVECASRGCQTALLSFVSHAASISQPSSTQTDETFRCLSPWTLSKVDSSWSENVSVSSTVLHSTSGMKAKHAENIHEYQRRSKCRTLRGPRPKSSPFRGVTHYKRTGRNKGKQIYFGASSTAEKAARAYDRAAIRYRSEAATLNFNMGDYEGELRQLLEISKEKLVAMLRQQSAGEGRPQPEYASENDMATNRSSGLSQITGEDQTSPSRLVKGKWQIM